MSSPLERPAERLGAFAERLHLLVCHLAGRVIAAAVEVDDVVQEVFLRVLATGPANWQQLDDERLWSYLATTARHTVIDIARALRSRAHGARLQRSDWSRTSGFEPAAATRGHLTRLVASEARRQLEAAFLRLSGEHRLVIGLRQFEGLSAEDTGRRMGRSAAAVHSLYRRALEAWAEAVPPSHRPT
jgi:RNA polymerase sigma factor (sigma-70 family)